VIETDPLINSFSIFDARGAVYPLVKDLKTRKGEKEVKATITLKIRNLKFL
jgi:hypothetical protein